MIACGTESVEGSGTGGTSIGSGASSGAESGGGGRPGDGGAPTAGSGSSVNGGTSGDGGTAAGGDGASTGGSLGGSGGGGHSGGAVFAGGGTSGSGSSGSGSSGSGSSAGSGGTPSGIEELLGEFHVYWDFETPDGDEIRPLVGTESLHIAGATLADGPTGRLLELAGEGSGAESLNAVIDSALDFSISAWVRLDQLDPYDTFVGLNGQQVSAAFLQKRSDDRLSFTTFPADDTSAANCVTTAEIKPRTGQWYFVVATRSSASREQRVYVDGVLSGKNSCAAGVFSANGPVSVGRGVYDAAPTDWVRGAVDELGLIGRVLEPEEIFEMYRAGRPEARHYLFAYFVEVTQGRGDGLRLAHSHDGLHWGAIGAGKVFMPPSVGGGSFRDPHLLLGPNGQYHLVWTTTCVPWAEENCVQDRGLGHATAPDLVTWTAADYIAVDLNVEHVWAPETYYDEGSEQFMVFWSSPLDDDPSASDPHDIYYVLTSDFETFTPPAVLYGQPGRNFIDATIRADGDGYLMVIKDEADGQKNLRALRSSALFGSGAWTEAPSAPLSGNYAAEGPSFLERDGELFIYFDKYGEGAYGALRASSGDDLVSPSAWQDISSSVFFPGVRHGTPIEVPWDVFRAVALEAGK